MKLPNKLKALKKDLELQVDFLIGYRPQGLHWKQESHLRQKMIDEAVGSEYLPEEAREKLLVILDTLITMRENERPEQPYLSEQVIEAPKQKIKFFDWKTQEVTYI